MKDLVDIFEQNERRFFGSDVKQGKCSYCKETFYVEDLTPVGEQVIRGNYVRNAKACHECEPVFED
jgi:hypothetical protein